MVRFLISAATQNATGGRRLLEGGAYSDLTVNGAALFWGPALIRGNKVLMAGVKVL